MQTWVPFLSLLYNIPQCFDSWSYPWFVCDRSQHLHLVFSSTEQYLRGCVLLLVLRYIFIAMKIRLVQSGQCYFYSITKWFPQNSTPVGRTKLKILVGLVVRLCCTWCVIVWLPVSVPVKQKQRTTLHYRKRKNRVDREQKNTSGTCRQEGWSSGAKPRDVSQPYWWRFPC